MWENDTGIDVTAAFMGITTPISELYDEIHKRGWTVKSVNVKDNSYLAQGANPHGEKIEATGKTDSTAVANLLLKIVRRDQARLSPEERLSSWSSKFDDAVYEIAEEYSKAKVYDPKAASSWMVLAHDNVRRAHHLHNQLKVEIVDDPNPYSSLSKMADDVLKKKKISVSRANPHHPIWSVDQVVAFRLVHDVLGHIVGGGDWSWHGMNLAFAAHAPLLTPEAQKALFTETLGQGAYNYTYRSLGPQKIVFLDALEKIQNNENPPGHAGGHPDDSIIPAEVAQIPKPENKTTSPKEGRFALNANGAIDTIVHFAASSVADPNEGFQSRIEPLPDNGYLWQKLDSPDGPIDPLHYTSLQDRAREFDTGWHSLSQPDGGPDIETGRQAVSNAFRASLLGARKTPQATAQHYQAIMGLPANTNDPARIHQTIEDQRDAHNVGRGYNLPGLPAQSELAFKRYVKGLYPTLYDHEVQEVARQELFHMRAEEEERITAEDIDNKFNANDISAEADRNLAKRLQMITKPKVDQKYDFDSYNLYHSALNDIKPYPNSLATHAKSVAAVGHQIDTLHHAAVADMKRGGSGHHFRSKALGLNLPGIGPKEVSHAWYHLAPNSSQLGIVSQPVLDNLGHKAEEMNDRDYFKFERELMAGRDAAGYNHVPLGMFSKGFHDHVTLGPGQHDDLRHLSPLNPVAHSSIDWDARLPEQSVSPGYWWESTQPARDGVGQEWDRNIATSTPSDQIPFKTAAKVADAFSTFIPFFTHPTTGEVHEGNPGQSLMQHMTESLALSTPEVWALDAQSGKR